MLANPSHRRCGSHRDLHRDGLMFLCSLYDFLEDTLLWTGSVTKVHSYNIIVLEGHLLSLRPAPCRSSFLGINIVPTGAIVNSIGGPRCFTSSIFMIFSLTQMNTHVFKRQRSIAGTSWNRRGSNWIWEKSFHQENSKTVEQVAQGGCHVTLEISSPTR